MLKLPRSYFNTAHATLLMETESKLDGFRQEISDYVDFPDSTQQDINQKLKDVGNCIEEFQTKWQRELQEHKTREKAFWESFSSGNEYTNMPSIEFDKLKKSKYEGTILFIKHQLKEIKEKVEQMCFNSVRADAKEVAKEIEELLEGVSEGLSVLKQSWAQEMEKQKVQDKAFIDALLQDNPYAQEQYDILEGHHCDTDVILDVLLGEEDATVSSAIEAQNRRESYTQNRKSTPIKEADIALDIDI